MQLGDKTVAALRRHPSLKGKAVTKVSHGPILPTSPTLPNMRFKALFCPHCCWTNQRLAPNFPQTLIKMRGKKRNYFPSKSLIAPPGETSFSLCLVQQRRRRKNNPQPQTPEQYKTRGGDGGSSQKTSKSRGKGGDKSQP